MNLDIFLYVLAVFWFCAFIFQLLNGIIKNDYYEVLSSENQRLQKEISELKEFAEIQNRIINDLSK